MTLHDTSNSDSMNDNVPKQHKVKTYQTMLKLISGSLVGGANYIEIYLDQDEEDAFNSCSTNEMDTHNKEKNSKKVPTLPEIARKVAKLQKIQLDEKQYIAYEMIACTFLLGLVKDGRDAHTNLGAYLQQNLGGPTTTDIQDLVKRLKARGGQEHMLMFLTGPAGSGKSSALMVAQQFCYEFCLSVGVMWSDKTFLFTAYTGSAASLFGGVTISKAAFINQNSALSLDDINEWQGVRLLIIDEISFMSDSVLKKLDKKLKQIGNAARVFGGFSIIFSGDFRQLEPVCSNDSELLFSSLSSGLWDNSINVVIILDNDHRFKEDPEYGKMLKRMWNGDLTSEDRKKINTRVIGYQGLKLPTTFKGTNFTFIKRKRYLNCIHFTHSLNIFYYCAYKGEACYACPTNKERNSIQKAIFRQHIQATHPSVTTNDLPPSHTLIIEAHITSSNSKKNQKKIDKNLRNRIITTCGDADVMVGTKHIDPALCIYQGAHLICIDNKHLNSKIPRGNGTLCRVLGVKLKKNSTTYKWKNYYGKKVWTIDAKDVEYIQCEHVNKTGYILQLEAQIQELEKIQDKHQNNDKLDELKEKLAKIKDSRKFNLEPEKFSPEVNLKLFRTSFKKQAMRCKMTQIPANSNDGTTGHKLQGMSKDVIIVTSWPTGGLSKIFKNWEYVVLSRVRTLSGLYLVDPIDMEKSFLPSYQLRSYIDKIKQKEKDILDQRQKAMSLISWT